MNERIDTCFNVECMLLGRNFDFLGGYLVVTACYCSLLGGYWLLLLVPTISMNASNVTNTTAYLLGHVTSNRLTNICHDFGVFNQTHFNNMLYYNALFL